MMKLSLITTTAAVLFSTPPLGKTPVVHAQRKLQNNKDNKNNNNKNNNEVSKTWTTTTTCNCYEYLTDSFFRASRYYFNEIFSDGHHYENGNNKGYYHLSEFCCEFAAELVDPVCQTDGNGQWINSYGGAPVEHMICDLFHQKDVTHRSKLMQEARNACYCFYRDIGCGKEELGCGGYCDYANSEVTLDDFRMANNSAHNMCNSCLEKDGRYNFPQDYEGQSHDKCLGYCLLKRGDPNDVYAPFVTDERCCFDEHGFGLEVHGFEEDKVEQEIIFMPFAKFEKRVYDYFFLSPAGIPNFVPAREYEIKIEYDGLSTVFMTVERYGDGEPDYPPAEYYTQEFDMHCQPEHWDGLSVHVFDESPEGGIVFKEVTLDGVDLGSFGFVDQSPFCPDMQVLPDIVGVPGHNYTCITRPGGYGHLSGFKLQGLVELSGRFVGDDIGVELIVGCQKKKEEHTCCHDCCCGSQQHHTITGLPEKYVKH